MPGLVGQFDVGFALPLGHTSIWLRNAAGGSTGDRDDPLANFFFGGFGNNYVDNGEAKRYREVLSMPGFEIDAIGGRTFAKSMLELNLPPLRFEALGTPGFYVPWARSALFATALSTNFEDGDVRETVYNVGVQIDFQMHVMHRAADDAVVRLCARFRGRRPRRRRVHDLAQGPLMGAPRGPRSAQ